MSDALQAARTLLTMSNWLYRSSSYKVSFGLCDWCRKQTANHHRGSSTPKYKCKGGLTCKRPQCVAMRKYKVRKVSFFNCVECGELFVRRGSGGQTRIICHKVECRQARGRRDALGTYHRAISDPEKEKKIREARKKRYERNIEHERATNKAYCKKYYERKDVKDRARKRSKSRHKLIMEDPVLLEKLREYQRKCYQKRKAEGYYLTAN